MKLLKATIKPLIICWTSLMAVPAQAETFEIKGSKGNLITATVMGKFDSPWAMGSLPNGGLAVTTKPGMLWLIDKGGKKRQVSGLPKIWVGGQGGLGDVVPHPDFELNQQLYLSFVDSLDNGATRGAVVIRAELADRKTAPQLTKLEQIWVQQPKTQGRGHFSHRIAFGPKGSVHAGKLLITSGDRQALSPAQRWDMALGKLIRLNDDGTIPPDNPFQDKGPLAKTFWTLGHRNSLGIDFDQNQNLWAHEMGPRHGDELNLIKKGSNYGWPEVSEGNHYSGKKIPNHSTRPEFSAPKAAWVPSIAPSGFMIYKGGMFKQWLGNGFIGGLAGRALVRVTISGEKTKEAERFEWGKRIREVDQDNAGNIWVLEDGSNGRLLKLAPAQ